MIVLGLTGSIGMGKTTTAWLFSDAGVPVFDADQAVHRLYKNNSSIIEAIERRFPEAVKNRIVDRKVLARLVREHKDALKELEAIVHPAIIAARSKWLRQQEIEGHTMVVFDIPLLLETAGQEHVDFVIVVSAPKGIQRQRVLSRRHMTRSHFEHLLSRQMPDQEKRLHADFIIDTSKGLEDAKAQVQDIIRRLQSPNPTGKSRS